MVCIAACDVSGVDWVPLENRGGSDGGGGGGCWKSLGGGGGGRIALSTNAVLWELLPIFVYS